MNSVFVENFRFSIFKLAKNINIWNFIFIAHLFASLSRKKRKLFFRLTSVVFSFRLVLVFFIAGAVFISLNPYFILAREEAMEQWAANSARYGLKLSWGVLTSNNLSYYSLYYLYHYGLGPILSFLTIVGVVWGFLKHPRNSLFVLSVALPYLYVFLVVSGTGLVRNYSAIIPLFLFFPAILLSDLIGFVFKNLNKKVGVLKPVLATSLVLIVGLQGFYYSLVGSYTYSKEHNMISSYYWMQANIPDGSKIWGPTGIFYPGGKGFEALRVDINGNNFPAMEEFSNSPSKWFISSTLDVETGENLLFNKGLLKKVFFNAGLRDRLIENKYSNLVLREIADYRTAEFSKQMSQDPPYLIAYLPEFWAIRKDKQIYFDNFESSKGFDWTTEYYPENSFDYSVVSDRGFKKGSALVVNQNTAGCGSYLFGTYSSKIQITPGGWYSLVAVGKRLANPSFVRVRNGFLRLGFYNTQDILLKTFVSRPLSGKMEWETLTAAGLSPQEAAYARISFQVDQCLDSEEYTIDDVSLYQSEAPKMDLSKYPFYNKPLPKDFGWVPQP